MRINFRSALEQQDHGAKRSALLRLAILSSGLSKLCGLALQASAIPLVYRSLGPHHYALYLLLTGALGTIALAQMGAGPGLTQGIARANAADEHERAAALLRAAFRLAGAAAVVGGAVVLACVYLVPPGELFGPAFAANRDEILLATDVCIALFGLQVLASVVDSALAGYQEQMFTHIGTMLANLACIGLLFIVCQHYPSVIGVIVVLYGVPTLPRLVNIVVLAQRRPYLLRGFFNSARGSYGVLLNAGLAFWAMEIGGLFEQNGGNYVLAHLGSVQTTALFAVVYKSVVLAGAVVSTVTLPLWPAFADAIGHRDVEWIHRSYRKIRRALTIYSLIAAVVMITAGEWVFGSLMHVDTTGSGLLFVIFGCYFVANIWTHLYYVTLMGMDGLWRVALVLLAENLLMLVFGIVMVPLWGAAGMALAYLSASVLLPAWLLPRMLRQAIQRI